MQFKHSKDDEQGCSGDQNSQISFDLSALRGFKLEFNMIRVLQLQAT